ncbi:MAG: hypothetical protein R2769_10905 [Saprospiraceae bacterium]
MKTRLCSIIGTRLTYLSGPFSLALNIPVAMYRNRIKSVSILPETDMEDAVLQIT